MSGPGRSWWRRWVCDDADALWPVAGPEDRPAHELLVLYAAADAAEGVDRDRDAGASSYR